MLDAVGAGFLHLMIPEALLFMVIGTVYGLAIGIMPGLGGIVALALLLPFSYGFDPIATLGLLLSAHIATIWGSSVTSILFRVPGASKSVALIFDGYPMTQRGEAGRALGASATAAMIGGLSGAFFLLVSIPIIKPIMLWLGAPEYLMMALWGLTIIATFSEGSLPKGLIATAMGIILAFVGMSPVSGTPRFTFGSVFLLDGISFPVAMIGMFAISEMMKLYVKGGALVERDVGNENSSVMTGVRDALKNWWLIITSSLLGLWIGVLPGIGASVGGIAAYAQAAQTSRDNENFGKGDVRGVIAPDATIGANEGGGLMPTMVFGIPGGESMAILLVAFYNLGIQPGPDMMTNHLDVVFAMMWIIVLGNLFTTGIGLGIARYLARLPSLNPNLMIPLVVSVCFIGSFATRGRIEDVFVTAIFGVLGFFMDRYHYSRANLVIGFVLADMIERNLHISIQLYGDGFLLVRPVALAMAAFLVVTSALPFYRASKRRRAASSAKQPDGAKGEAR